MGSRLHIAVQRPRRRTKRGPLGFEPGPPPDLPQRAAPQKMGWSQSSSLPNRPLRQVQHHNQKPGVQAPRHPETAKLVKKLNLLIYVMHK
jgi:hypothetical protein